MLGRCREDAGRARARRRTGREQEGQVTAALVPGRVGGVAEKDGRVDREREPGDPRDRLQHRTRSRGDPRQVEQRRSRRRGARGEQKPASQVHRRAGLEDTHHVEEALGPAEVLHEQRGADVHRCGGDEGRAPGQHRVPGRSRHAGHRRRRARQPSGEEVPADLALPHGRLHDRAPVVRRIGHEPAPSRPARNAAPSPARSAAPATAAVRHIPPRSRVESRGCGGSP